MNPAKQAQKMKEKIRDFTKKEVKDLYNKVIEDVKTFGEVKRQKGVLKVEHHDGSEYNFRCCFMMRIADKKRLRKYLTNNFALFQPDDTDSDWDLQFNGGVSIKIEPKDFNNGDTCFIDIKGYVDPILEAW